MTLRNLRDLVILVSLLGGFIQSAVAASPYATWDYTNFTYPCNFPQSPGGIGMKYVYTPACNPGDTHNVTTHGVTSDGAVTGVRTHTSSPTGAEHEVEATLHFGSTTGTFVLYVGNRSNETYPPSSPPSSIKGTYAITIDHSSGSISGPFTATVRVRRVKNASSYTLATNNVTINPDSVVRAVRTNVGGTWKVLVYIGTTLVTSVVDSTLTSSYSRPGFGVNSANPANYVTHVKFYAIEHGAPDYNSLNNGLLSAAAPNHVTLQWNPVTDSAGGSGYGASGVAFYEIYRNGALRTTVHHQGTTMSYADTGLTPGTTYTYLVRAYDFHGNSTDVTRNITTPTTTITSSTTLPRRIGLPTNVSTWGSAPESLDLLSGNLNLTFPVLTAAGRNGYGVPLLLSYNSQNWVEEGAVISHYGPNLGFGYGWRMQFGAIRPVLLGSSITHFIYEDGTGAQYPLDVLSGSLWRPSQFAPVLEYDSSTNRLWFKDGSFWQMDCVSSSGEQDANSRYPTLMQDSSGNQIYIRYRVGKNASWPNSSSRLDEVEDVAAHVTGGTRRTYFFTYQSDGSLPERLYQVTRQTNVGGVTDTTTFTQSASTITLKSPENQTVTGGSTRYLTKIAKSGAGETNFAYHGNDAGELSRITLPYGGYMDYTYVSATYSGKTVRHVSERKLTPTPGGSTYTYDFTRTSGGTIPATTRVEDASGESDKIWTFDTSTSSMTYGLWTLLEERSLVPSATVKRRQAAFYNSQPPNKVFVQGVDTTSDPGTGNATTLRHTQWLDGYGNLWTSAFWEYDALVAPVRTIEYRYWSSSSNRIFNRLQTKEVHEGATVLSLQSNTYANNFDAGASCPYGLENFDTSLCGNTWSTRGHLATTTAGGLTTTFKYDVLGNVVRTTGPGPEITSGISSATNFAMPDIITPNSIGTLATSFSYNADYQPTQTTAPNSAISNTYYDSYGRVDETRSATGAETSYTYGIDTGSRVNTVKISPQLQPNDFRFSRNTVDGLGRPIKAESGGSDWVADTISETEYAPCACSPSGKVKRVSLPYAPGGTVKWTTYTYDALGRTLTVALPDSAGTTTYEYVKNTVKITDAAQKWKKYETNGMGQLVKVYEPNPAGGADLVTTYTYNLRGQLATAVMTRGSTTQTRTFTYDLATGRLSEVTKPETGTTEYSYNTDGTVAHTIDAKGQKTTFSYDSLKRVTNVKRFIDSSGVFVEQPCQEVIYSYDSGGGGSNLAGRLAAVTAKQCDGNISEYSEVYSYETWGGLQWRDSKWKRSGSTLTRRVDPGYNAMGLMTSFGYGTVGSLYSYAYTFDNAWRPATMTGESLTLVNNITYNAAGAMTAFTRDDGSGTAVNNSYTFNALYQMTNQTVTKGGATLQNLTYTFSATQNNGQILSQTDAVSGETVEYQYDALNRLTSAATTDPSWGLSWTYDGFGNRTNQTVTKGSAPSHSVTVDENTNRLSAASGYYYDANGNMTTMPLMTMAYDVANRMVSSNHSSAGTQTYGYNHANQRVFLRSGSTVTYYLYGLGGERLMEFQETCTASCTGYTENQRWIYFAGRKMFSKTGSTLKAITPNRLASEAKHFPYGETDGTPPSDTKDYFATYRRDGTGLDYAWNRYYSPTTGRFMTADPYGGSENLYDPESFNRYSYVGNNPVNRLDNTGLYWWSGAEDLFACLYNPWDNHAAWTWTCGSGTLPYSEEMMHVLGPWYLQQAESNWSAASANASVLPPLKPGSSNFVSAVAKAFNAINGLKRHLLDRNCDDSILVPLGLTADQIRSHMDKINILNANDNRALRTELYQNQPLGVYMTMVRIIKTETVGDFTRQHRGTTALAQTPGVNVYIKPEIINSQQMNDARLQSTILHEAIHNITGLFDHEIQSKLNLQVGAASGNITAEIMASCF